MRLYQQVISGRFVDRPNRFIAHVETNQGIETCHVKNTGRCRELLVPGAEVTLAVANQPGRKTRCDLVAVRKGPFFINMDSQAPNCSAQEALPRLFEGLTLIRPETVYGASRLDFYLEAGERKIFLEVKGVTLEENGIALFPDAPTERSIKHLRELARCVSEGYEAALLFVIQMKGVSAFMPNRRTHPAFANALAAAQDAGVRLMAYDCLVTPDSQTLDAQVPILL
ncbi:MAG: DNA/RNA nuclease SfsA [Clostridia bacterium]|nr:DNA/RNA nuclease SfsA [Clostridia bacterium]